MSGAEGDFTRVVRSAKGLSKPETSAARSVFEVSAGISSSEASIDRPTLTKKRNPPISHAALQLLRLRGPLTVEQCVQALTITKPRATKLLSNLKRSGRVETMSEEGKQTLFQLVDRATKTPTVAAVSPPKSLEHFACGLFNSGELLLEVGEKTVRLKREQVRNLVDYLDLFSLPGVLE